MISKYCYLTPVQTLFLKGFAILCIMSHNFFHWVPPVTYENEMHFYPMYFSRFLQDFTWPDAINCLFSFWGFYGVYLFIFLSRIRTDQIFYTPSYRKEYKVYRTAYCKNLSAFFM